MSDEGAALTYQACAGCGARWWFRRERCPTCGRAGPLDRASAGEGTVEAVTVVHRPPSDDWRPYAPYALVLVWMDEEFRAMGLADRGLAIGERVTARSAVRAGNRVPVFGRLGTSAPVIR